MERILTYRAGAEYDGARLDTFLRTKCKMSGSLIKELKRADGGLTVNSEAARSVDILREGDEVRVTMRESGSENIVPVKLGFGVEYEDEDIIVINKPPKMAAHISAGHYDDTLSNALAYYFKEKGEEYMFRAVGRLDKDTSGLLCAAKNKYAHARMCGAFTEKAIKRSYIALLHGELEGEGTVDAPIGRCADSVIKRRVTAEGRRAVTRYRAVKSGRGFTKAHIELETGRTHQIRVHMAHIGCPLLGDWLYGMEDLFPRTALHSYKISFIHPVTEKPMSFTAEPPEDMREFEEKYL